MFPLPHQQVTSFNQPPIIFQGINYSTPDHVFNWHSQGAAADQPTRAGEEEIHETNQSSLIVQVALPHEPFLRQLLQISQLVSLLFVVFRYSILLWHLRGPG